MFKQKFLFNLANCLFIGCILFTFIFASALMFVYNYVLLSFFFCLHCGLLVYLYQLWRSYYE